ncbi:probable receptor-like protein kinase At2g23200 [Medicago truncatula]|nr:probable receptor-like protein kinase At2g23200 [Medicago truncatula]
MGPVERRWILHNQELCSCSLERAYLSLSLPKLELKEKKELSKATDNFSPANKIGEGGFSSVYMGRLKNGKLAAIKVLSAESRQGAKEFLTEISVISEVEHENLMIFSSSLQLEVTVVSTLIGEHDVKYVLTLHAGLPFCTKKSGLPSFIGIQKQAIFSLTKILHRRFRILVFQADIFLAPQLHVASKRFNIHMLQRAWKALNWTQKLSLLTIVIRGITSSSEISTNKLEKASSDDATLQPYEQLSFSYPSLLPPLIHERDTYLAWSLKRSKAVNNCKRVVGVIGKGHMDGVIYALLADTGNLRFRDLAGKNSNDGGSNGWIDVINLMVLYSLGNLSLYPIFYTTN